VFIFPEGTFTAHEGMRPFQLGAFKAAAATGCPVVPIGVSGMRQFMRDGTWLPRHARITVKILPPWNRAPASSAASAKSGWQEMVRMRDAVRSEIAHIAGERLL
jgi:1-acyl-sn-glycerol-3-phosphate acyltransferase